MSFYRKSYSERNRYHHTYRRNYCYSFLFKLV